MDETTQGQDWGSWLQDIGKTVISGYAAADNRNANMDFQLARDKLQYLGDTGYYPAGQPATASRNASSSTIILMVAALAVVFLLVEKH